MSIRHPGRKKFRPCLASLCALDSQHTCAHTHTHTPSLKHFCSLEWPTRYDPDPLLCGSHKCLCVNQDYLQQGRSPQTSMSRENQGLCLVHASCPSQVSGATVTVTGQGPRQVESAGVSILCNFTSLYRWGREHGCTRNVMSSHLR